MRGVKSNATKRQRGEFRHLQHPNKGQNKKSQGTDSGTHAGRLLSSLQLNLNAAVVDPHR